MTHDYATWLRTICRHDSRSVDGCRYCEVAEELERQHRRLAKARAILEPMADCDQEIREWLK